MSRVVGWRRVLGDQEKEQFVEPTGLYERFYGLRIVTFCITGNHFHFLVGVPKRPEAEVLPTDEALVALVVETKGKDEAFWLNYWLTQWQQEGNHAAAEAERERWIRQMWDVSQFMKVLKQRFTQWFNGRQPKRRKGTLWEDRFRSVLVEDGQALHTMAAYIDLNPIRAGQADDPADDRWSGNGEAAAGEKVARLGPGRLVESLEAAGVGIKGELLAWYRLRLFGRGAERTDAEGETVKMGFTEEQIEAEDAVQGETPLPKYLLRRVRYFTDGAALGSREFVNALFQSRRGWFGEKRKTGARPLRGLGRASPLRTLRDLKVEAGSWG